MPFGLSTIIRFYYLYPECEPYGIKNKKNREVVKRLFHKSEIALDYFPMVCIYELLKLSNIVRKNLKHIITPILLIHSNEDDLTSKKSAYFVYNKISSDIKNIIILNDSYHMLLYDNEKDYVYKVSSLFLNSLKNDASDFKFNVLNQDIGVNVLWNYFLKF